MRKKCNLKEGELHIITTGKSRKQSEERERERARNGVFQCLEEHGGSDEKSTRGHSQSLLV